MTFYRAPKCLIRLFPAVLWRVRFGDKELYLTFDDGPCDSTPSLLELLSELEITATFFVTGGQTASYPGKVAEIIASGHLIGNHSYSHNNLFFTCKNRIAHEITRTDELLASLGAPRPHHFRPPYGAFSPAVLRVARELSKTTVMWTLNSYDFAASFDEAHTASLLARYAQSGGILLFHESANFSKTARCLRLLIPQLKARGFNFAALPVPPR